jgi:Ca2+-binding RTX toxin-like protein
MSRARFATAAALATAALAATAAGASADPVVAIDHHTLVVRGDDANDKLALRLRAKTLEVDFGDNGSADAAVKRSKFDRIRVAPGGGDDVVRFVGTDCVPTSLDGDLGFDTVTFEGSNGDDRFDLSAKDGPVRLGRSTDIAGVESLEVARQGGADTMTVDPISGTELETLYLNLGAGDGRRDRAILNGTAGDDNPDVLGFAGVSVIGLPTFVTIDNAEPTDQLTVNGRGGDDFMGVSSLPKGAIAVTLDGGRGADVLFGGDGDDVLVGGPDFDDVDGGKGDDRVLLGSDSDRFTWRPGQGNDVVDGQAGHDVLSFFGSNDAETLDLSARGRRLRLARDVENVVTDLDDVEEIDPVVFGGTDTIAVGDLSATAVDQVNVNLEPTVGSPGGDGQPDRVIATGTEGDDAVTVAGGANGALAVIGLAAPLGITTPSPPTAWPSTRWAATTRSTRRACCLARSRSRPIERRGARRRGCAAFTVAMSVKAAHPLAAAGEVLQNTRAIAQPGAPSRPPAAAPTLPHCPWPQAAARRNADALPGGPRGPGAGRGLPARVAVHDIAAIARQPPACSLTL